MTPEQMRAIPSYAGGRPATTGPVATFVPVGYGPQVLILNTGERPVNYRLSPGSVPASASDSVVLPGEMGVLIKSTPDPAVISLFSSYEGSTVRLLSGAPYLYSAGGLIIGVMGFGADIAPTTALIIGDGTQGAGKEIFQVARTDTNANAVSRPTVAYVEGTAAPASAGTFDFHTLDVLGKVSGANTNISATTGIYAIEGKSTIGLTASQTLGNSIGVFGTSVNFSGAGSTVSVSAGVYGHVQNTGLGTTTVGAAFFVKSPTVTAGQISNAYGLFVQAITAGSAQNFAIQTNAGQINFFASTATPVGGTALVGMTMGSAKVGLYWGSGAPTLSAAQGSLYMRTDGGVNSRLYANTNGTTGWTPLTNAA